MDLYFPEDIFFHLEYAYSLYVCSYSFLLIIETLRTFMLDYKKECFSGSIGRKGLDFIQKILELNWK